MAVSPIQIASNVIEKLQEENRISLETLHKTQSEIKYLQKQLFEKDQLIKLLEERLRRGTNPYLEVNNRQKEITIKHLELQIQRLLKENQELDLQINSVKADLCRKCENKLLSGGVDKRTVSKPVVKKSAKDPGKASDVQNNENILQRIIEHKDKRIDHLSKEVQKLTHTEKKLTEKIYRLTKLLPMSQMPSEMVIECLLSEIKSLETQIQLHKGIGAINTFKPKLSVKGVSIQPHSCRSPGKEKVGSPKKNVHSEMEDLENDGSMLVVSKLHKLFSDVSELKQVFALENEKMHQNLSKNSMRQEALKVQWKDIIRKLNEISESIEFIMLSNSNSTDCAEKERLQDMLKSCLELNSQYEEENASLKEELERLSERLAQEQKRLEGAERKARQCSEEFSKLEGDFRNDVHEVQLLKAQLREKQRQLDFTENHLKTCQALILELQKLPKEPPDLPTKRVAFDVPDNSRQLQSLERKLDVAEKNIKSCEEVIEELQKVIRNLEEENSKLDSDLHLAKLNKVVSDANANHYVSLKTKLDETEGQLMTVTSKNQDLQNKLAFLEEQNGKLQTDLNTCNNNLSRGSFLEKNALRAKLDAAERTIKVLENNLVQLQTSIEKLKEENQQLRLKVRSNRSERNLAETYQDDVSFLRNEMSLKDEEIERLKESLETFERKVFEINHYRKALRQEIRKLCDALTADDKSGSDWRSIYNAAILRSAQAILRLDDDDCSPQADENGNDALEEMKHQVSVYLTEVARIHELLTLKSQQREEMIRQYLSETCVSGTLSREFFVSEDTPQPEAESHPVSQKEVGGDPSMSPVARTVHSGSPRQERMDRAASPMHGSALGVERTFHKAVNTSPIVCPPPSTATLESEVRLDGRQGELEASKSATSYFLAKCSELEQLLGRERAELEQARREASARLAELEELRRRLRVEEEARLRQREDEISAEQLRREVRWLGEENRRTLERVSRTQAELRGCQEENARVQSDLDELRRQLVNERYEHAKVNSQLRHLRMQLAGST